LWKCSSVHRSGMWCHGTVRLMDVVPWHCKTDGCGAMVL